MLRPLDGITVVPVCSQLFLKKSHNVEQLQKFEMEYPWIRSGTCDFQPITGFTKFMSVPEGDFPHPTPWQKVVLFVVIFDCEKILISLQE